MTTSNNLATSFLAFQNEEFFTKTHQNRWSKKTKNGSPGKCGSRFVGPPIQNGISFPVPICLISTQIYCCSEIWPLKFSFSALHSAYKFPNKQQISYHSLTTSSGKITKQMEIGSRLYTPTFGCRNFILAPFKKPLI